MMANEKHCARLEPHTANVISTGGYTALADATVLANLIFTIPDQDSRSGSKTEIAPFSRPLIRAQSHQHPLLSFRSHGTWLLT